jgi:hypothetical protein
MYMCLHRRSGIVPALTSWAQLEAVVGAEKRLKLIARDIVEHLEKRLEAMDGKAMVVCMSRRIAVELYRELVKLRPKWHSDADDAGPQGAHACSMSRELRMKRPTEQSRILPVIGPGTSVQSPSHGHHDRWLKVGQQFLTPAV